ncbi:hypothetical protein GCM10009754_77060 [Amycolatopsis minnesotensis]|uniref:Uncharacterized protein n=1 Tax=Amycolatopsis minnesotensis TaxID=337894 RepID=A0ABP5E0B7_9PSEU
MAGVFVPLFVGEGPKNKVLFSKSAMGTDHRTAKSGGISGNPGLSGVAGDSGAPPRIKVVTLAAAPDWLCGPRATGRSCGSFRLAAVPLDNSTPAVRMMGVFVLSFAGGWLKDRGFVARSAVDVVAAGGGIGPQAARG